MRKLSGDKLFKSKVHIVGVSGAEGAAVALWLIRGGNQQVVGHDFKTAREFDASFCSYHLELSKTDQTRTLAELKTGLHKLHLRDTYLAGINEADFVIVPSSWFRYSSNKPKLTRFIKQHPNRVFTLYTLLLELYQGQTIGVTGTAGKGTTVRLISQMLPKAQTFGAAWQNIDVAKILAHGRKRGTLVIEVNNRQLTLASHRKVSPTISVITNITVNHLDDHNGSFAEYRQAKWQLLAYQKRSGVAVLNADNPHCRLLARRAKSKVRLFSVSARPDVDATIREGWFCLKRGRQWQKVASFASVALFLRNSPYLQSDALAAVVAADAAGAGIRAIAKALWNFNTQEGRLTIIKKQKNITYVNDTASTRPEATTAAVTAFAKTTIHLIIGGSRNHPQTEQYEEMFKNLKSANIQTIALIGSLAPWLAKRAARVGLPKGCVLVQSGTLAEAVTLCQRRAARAGQHQSQVILLSPGCESFGEFVDYRQRGEKFTELVNS